MILMCFTDAGPLLAGEIVSINKLPRILKQRTLKSLGWREPGEEEEGEKGEGEGMARASLASGDGGGEVTPTCACVCVCIPTVLQPNSINTRVHMH